MDAENTQPKRKKWWRPTTRSEQVAVCMLIVFIISLLFLLSGQKSFSIIPSQSWFNTQGWKNGSNQTFDSSNSNHLDGLTAPNFSKKSCLSRYEYSTLYHKISPHKPSSYLLNKLRNYEALHKKCGPNTPLYRKSIKQLKSGHSNELMECNYMVWIPHGPNGLGNRILSLTSTFLYALLTNRVLLIQQTPEMVDLFCEPFPDTSWILPPNFPIKDLPKLNILSNVTYGNMLDKHVIRNNDPKTQVESLPAYVFAYLLADYRQDQLFFCNDDQIVLSKVNWLLVKSDVYFVPIFYSISLFEEELHSLFPAKTSIFYLLAHYLIHPSNTVWGLVTSYYMANLAKADVKIGIQVRVFHFTRVSSNVILQQILNCSKIEGVLPEIDLNGTKVFETIEPKSKAILVASLYSKYYENLKSMYYEHSVKTGEYISVHQPSHEGRQSTEKQSHNHQALAEIYLLSLCDVLMTSGWSTFGYVSYGISGIKPVILMPIWDKRIPDRPCFREVSSEPCHLTPPKPNCNGKTFDKEKMQQYVKPCHDDHNGIKLFD